MTLADDPGYAVLMAHLRAREAPSLDLYKDRCLQRRLATRMRACGARSLSDYAAHVAATPREMDRLLAALTINVTGFFRNPESWDRLEGELLALSASGTTPLRAWSAGCASGEEAYSLAILLAGLGIAAAVEATDVDAGSLARAREAWYPERAMVGLSPALRGRWTIQEGEGARMAPALRAMVRVRHGDLGAEPPQGPPYDLIVCRNVLIYFTREVQARVVRGFADRLRPGGLLFLGKVELLPAAHRSLFEPVDARERIVRRVVG